MKYPKMVYGLLVVLTLVCCRENFTGQLNSPTYNDKVGSDPEVNNVTFELSEMKGEINLCCEVLDPVKGKSQVSGKLKYKHNTIQRLDNKTIIKVHLELDAELLDKLISPLKYTIYGISIDTISMTSGGKLLIDKTYGILNRPDLKMCVQYLITPFSIKIIQVNLLPLVK